VFSNLLLVHSKCAESSHSNSLLFLLVIEKESRIYTYFLLWRHQKGGKGCSMRIQNVTGAALFKSRGSGSTVFLSKEELLYLYL
jgi:hypothetical protein